MNVISRTNADDIIDGQILGSDFFFLLTHTPACFGWSQLDERFNGFTRSFSSAGFDDFTRQHEEGHDPGGFVIPGGKRGQNRNTHQLVDGQFTLAQVFERHPDNRIPQDDRANHRTGTGSRVGLLKQPVQQKCIDNKQDSDEGLLQPHRRVLMTVMVVPVVMMVMIMPVILFLLAQKGGDLHKGLVI